MARLYLLRHGTGDARVASSFVISPNDVARWYGDATVHSSQSLPTINSTDGPASDVGNPQVVVIEFIKGESAGGTFRCPGFNLLVDVDPLDAYNRLVKDVS